MALAILGFALVRVAADEESPSEKRVVLLVNARSEDSLAVARHYAERRGVPAENIIALPMPMTETIGWRAFIDEIYQPLQDELVRRGWLEATGSNLKDTLGRKKYVTTGHRIAYLVTCRGVPLRVAFSPELFSEVPPLTKVASFRTNSGAVDSELTMVVRSGYPIGAYVPNPLFQNVRPTRLDLGKLVKVARLDGPTQASALALVDRALEAERTGLIGRAYVDRGGPHAEGEQWLEETVNQLEAQRFDLTLDRAPTTLEATTRFDAPALYFGWYTGEVSGPFTRPGFQFPPGAIALHIHSFSAETLASAEKFWCGPLIARGVTATFGNVYEPYLSFTHQPHLLLRALLRGDALGEAAFYALRAVSWQCVLIGDPLYRPFRVGFAEQWEKRARLSAEVFPYVVLREMRRLEREGQPEQALRVGRAEFEQRPGLVLAVKLAQSASELGRKDETRAWLKEVGRFARSPSDEPVAAEALTVLEKLPADKANVAVFDDWLRSELWMRETRLRLLRSGAVAAETVEAQARAEQWRREAEALAQTTRK
jgi:uncharacterized protein (TIGR03790 family)